MLYIIIIIIIIINVHKNSPKADYKMSVNKEEELIEINFDSSDSENIE
jgi:hypothetical protein